ncbi:hypothetical protein [uncultured Phenylobacterium sp.]|uniref:hypothetical protein n=1 Tax=uncultured Phenylobacterium sp. TaxID=349273 RepID=UPI0025FCF2BD|nr:hypothetical protein [uncultured Phenylobacterium sp.]
MRPSQDRTVRSLIALEKSASTARVLNLAATHRRHGADGSLQAEPFFHNRLLNHAIIIKHRLRPYERDLFVRPAATVTKILAPMDAADLKVGARVLMVGQKDFDETAAEVFGNALNPGSGDRQILDLIDGLPSLDPFLLREHLKRHGFEPARAYFAITDADIQRMYDFVRQEVMALVTLSAGGEGAGVQAASKLVEKLLSNSADDSFAPLKDTLRLSDTDYQDGVFCWRGFLYYKWVLTELTPQLARVMVELTALQPRGARTPDTTRYLPDARLRIEAAVTTALEGVNRMLAVYDDAYGSLTLDGQPAAFRDFLLAAPDMFTALGEQCGAVQHIVSFWRYRFPPGRSAMVDADELMDIFLDFEDGLTFVPARDVHLA